ncbi:hypothetical protein [Chryseobacterium sp. OSA05B]|uniref:hypothetical protein n=1 Tax=Chryseobacterium sp. OSA05B TaxID=2862650 RepID=UPI001CBB4AEE|nr:hypothetical protein [Chryseobacterium sp. OSA05B]
MFTFFLLGPSFLFSQELDQVIVKQNLLFRNPLTTKDYGLHGNVKKLEKRTSFADPKISTVYETLFFSGTGLLTKKAYYSEGEKEPNLIYYYHYNNNRLDSITNTHHIEKEVFNYDDRNRLIKKITYGKYDETKDEIDEAESFHYNSENYIIKSVKDSANLVMESKYNKKKQIIQIKSYYTNNPENMAVTEYQFQTLYDKPDVVITKRNEKTQNTTIYKCDIKGNHIETITISQNKTANKIQNSMIYDQHSNITSNIISDKGNKISETVQKIEYY